MFLKFFPTWQRCCHFSTSLSTKSAWVKRPNFHGDVETIFINTHVQALLKTLTGLELKNKIFSKRKIQAPQRSHYALMNDEMIEEMWKKMEERGIRFLQFVPLKEPRKELYQVLDKNEEICGFDSAKFIFTDITFDATNQDRVVVVRESDSTLRTALPEEHDRMNRVFYEQFDRPVNEPPLFSEPHLTNALYKNMHEFVLDWACYFFEPDDPRYVKLCKSIYEKTVKDNKFGILYSTRHFGSLVFYLVINENDAELQNFFNEKNSDPKFSNQLLDSFAALKSIINRLCEKTV